MTNLTLSRRYAKALLAIGKEDGRYEQYGQELADFASVLEQNDELFQALTNPIYPALGRGGVLEEILAKSGYNEVVKRFLLYVQEKERMGFIAEINQVYGQMVDEISGLIRATVTSAAPLSGEVEERVKATLEKMTGKNILLNKEENPDLIGGLVAQVGDLVLDGSIRTQLEGLKGSLKGVG